MKLFLFLFGIYLLALSCLPCADKDYTGEGTVAAIGTTHNKDCRGDENCPPFCTCSCCSIHVAPVVVETISLLPLQQIISNRKGPSPQQSLFSGAGNSIWQPPRLG